MGAILHLSDLHFGTERAEVVDALVDMAAGLAAELDLIVLSGDITQRARNEQFAAAAAFVARLPAVPRLVVPGNHDIPLYDLWTRLVRPLRRYARAFGDAAPVGVPFSNDDWLVVPLDSTRRWRHKHGELSAAQIDAVRGLAGAARPGQARLVVLHHPLEVPSEWETPNRVRNRERAVRRWARDGVDAVLGGHIHWPCVLRLPTPRRAWAVLAGTGTSTRIRRDADNSVNVLRRSRRDGDELLIVERMDFEPAAAAASGPLEAGGPDEPAGPVGPDEAGVVGGPGGPVGSDAADAEGGAGAAGGPDRAGAPDRPATGCFVLAERRELLLER